MLKFHNIQILFAFSPQKLLPKIIYLCRWKKFYSIILLPSQQEKSLEEKVLLLKKNLCTKDEIIKELAETQSTVLVINIQTLKINLTRLKENSHSSEQLASHDMSRIIHLMYDPVLHNCKKYRMPFKHTTKDPSEILQ